MYIWSGVVTAAVVACVVVISVLVLQGQLLPYNHSKNTYGCDMDG